MQCAVGDLTAEVHLSLLRGQMYVYRSEPWTANRSRRVQCRRPRKRIRTSAEGPVRERGSRVSRAWAPIGRQAAGTPPAPCSLRSWCEPVGTRHRTRQSTHQGQEARDSARRRRVEAPGLRTQASDPRRESRGEHPRAKAGRHAAWPGRHAASTLRPAWERVPSLNGSPPARSRLPVCGPGHMGSWVPAHRDSNIASRARVGTGRVREGGGG